MTGTRDRFQPAGVRAVRWRWAALLLAVAATAALLGPLAAPHDPNTLDAAAALRSPGTTGWLGTDHLGRDVLSRLLWGARTSVLVGLAAVAAGGTAGAALGLVSGFAGGRFDLLAQRAVDALQAFPALVLALAVVAVVGREPPAVVAAIALGFVAPQARVLRAAALTARGAPHVEGARAAGATELRVLLLHVLPACAAPYLVVASAELGGAVLLEASLGFLGLGVAPPDASWGGMLIEAQPYARQAPWLAVAPGLTISLTVLGASLLGDAVRDALDPHLARLR